MCVRKWVSNAPDLISANGCWLRNQATIISFKMSGHMTLENSRNLSYGQTNGTFKIQNTQQ